MEDEGLNEYIRKRRRYHRVMEYVETALHIVLTPLATAIDIGLICLALAIEAALRLGPLALVVWLVLWATGLM